MYIQKFYIIRYMNEIFNNIKSLTNQAGIQILKQIIN